MISPHTPPGTEVVALVSIPPRNDLPALVKGAIYTVDRIVPATEDGDGIPWGVVLREEGSGIELIKPPFWAFWRAPRTREWSRSLTVFRYLHKAAREEHYARLAPLDEEAEAQ